MKEKDLKQLKKSELLKIVIEQDEKLNELEGKDKTDTPGDSSPQETQERRGRYQAQLAREEKREKYFKTLRRTIYALLVVAAVAVLIAMLFTPVFQIFGKSMQPTIHNLDYVVSVKTKKFKQGDVVALYYNNRILVKRVIANPGEWVDISKDGTVSVNGKTLDEPYIEHKSYGKTNIKLPYQVPESRIFVMGDNRAVSVDSRNTQVGCISTDQVAGKLLFRIWPLKHIGFIH
ncbi:MAG: signal peptidase I [Lachnospiraceae bacterium]|nr:signal peptidase I [Lachnospiraceae bacterium]